jgi:hypothetical protein
MNGNASTISVLFAPSRVEADGEIFETKSQRSIIVCEGLENGW